MSHKKLNKRGFTLIELLAALVILTVIMGIAIPNISSSLERTKDKQNESRIKVLEAAAELYVTDHKNAIYNNLDNKNVDQCYISIEELDISEENKVDADDKPFNGKILFSQNDLSYKYIEKNDLNVSIEEC